MTSLAQSPARWSDESNSSVRARSRPDDRASRGSPAPNEGADPELLAAPVSFRVYTPDEMRSAPLRPSNRPAPPRKLGDGLKDELASAEAAGPRALLKWLGIGVAIGSLLLTAFVLLLNLTDDTRVAVKPTATRSTMTVPDRVTPSFHVPTIPTVTSVDNDRGTDFEIPDDTPPIQTASSRTAKSRPSAKPAGKPKMPLRAPF